MTLVFDSVLHAHLHISFTIPSYGSLSENISQQHLYVGQSDLKTLGNTLSNISQVLISSTNLDLSSIKRHVNTTNDRKALFDLATAKIRQILNSCNLDYVQYTNVLNSGAPHNLADILVYGIDLEVASVERNISTTDDGQRLLDVTGNLWQIFDVDTLDEPIGIFVNSADLNLPSIERNIDSTNDRE